MNQAIANAIRNFVTTNPPPTVTELLDRDAPRYEWTTALVQALVGQPLTVRPSPTSETTDLLSTDGTSVLRITVDESGTRVAEGLMAKDLKGLVSAIRIHEVESYDLVMLPPDIRRNNLESLCKDADITTERLRHLTHIWMTWK